MRQRRPITDRRKISIESYNYVAGMEKFASERPCENGHSFSAWAPRYNPLLRATITRRNKFFHFLRDVEAALSFLSARPDDINVVHHATSSWLFDAHRARTKLQLFRSKNSAVTLYPVQLNERVDLRLTDFGGTRPLIFSNSSIFRPLLHFLSRRWEEEKERGGERATIAT